MYDECECSHYTNQEAGIAVYRLRLDRNTYDIRSLGPMVAKEMEWF